MRALIVLLIVAVAVLGAPSETLATGVGRPADGVLVVDEGDTLAALSKRFRVPVATIKRLNPRTKDWTELKPGQQVNLPDSAFSAPGATPDPSIVPGKVVYVSIGKQRMTVYENGELLKTFKVSTGEIEKPTKVGNFRVKTKMDSAWSRSWQLTMPNWIGIYDIFTSENGIHALPINTRGRKMWAGLIGRRVSYGCVVLNDADAKWLYGWIDMGTPVLIRN